MSELSYLKSKDRLASGWFLGISDRLLAGCRGRCKSSVRQRDWQKHHGCSRCFLERKPCSDRHSSFCLCKQREEHTPTAAEYSFRKCTAWDCVPQVERQGVAPEKHQGQIGFPDADRDYTPQDRCFLLLLHQERSSVSHGARPVPIGQEIQQIQTPPSRWLFYLQNYHYTTRTVSRFSSPNQLG